MENITQYNDQKEFHTYVSSTFSDLKALKVRADKEEFNKLLLSDLTQIKRYIVKRLNTALSKGILPRGKYRPDDFLNQLFIIAFDHFDEVKNKIELYPWLFKKADALLDDTIAEEEFDEVFFENIDNFTKPAWDAMEEKFSTDGDGDLVMLNELDDISYRKDDYILNHVFVEDGKKEMMVKLDKQLGREAIRKHTNMVLRHLPSPMSTVFELATEYQFNVEQIASIRNQSHEKIQQLLDNARESLEASFFNRYFVENP